MRSAERSSGKAAATVLALGMALALGNGALASDAPDEPDRQERDASNDPKLRAINERAAEEARRFRDTRATPEAREQRRQSRAAFANASGLEAMRIFSEQSKALLAPAWQPPQLARGDRVERYLGDHALVIDQESGPNVFVESLTPLRATDQDGRKAALDLRLERRSESYRPRNAAADVEMPTDLRNGVELKRTGIRLRPEAVAAGVEPSIVGGEKLFYPNVATDTDHLVVPTPSGVETFSYLRSAESPEDHSLSLELPGDAVLTETHHPNMGKSGIAVVDGGRRLATITPPQAWDADGVTVPVSYQASGSRLTMRVPHRGRDVRYPVTLDPTFTEENFDFQNGSNYDGWFPQENFWAFNHFAGASWFGTGMYIWNQEQGWYTHDQWGEWAWRAYPNTAITEWRFYAHHIPQSTCLRGYTFSWDRGVQDPKWACHDFRWGWFHSVPANPSNDNYAIFNLVMNGSGWRDYNAWALLLAGWMKLTDFNQPYFNNWNGGPAVVHHSLPTGWVRSAAPQADLYGMDSGLGMKKLRLTYPPRDPGGGERYVENGCWGDRHSRCPDRWAHGVPYSTADMPEGVNTVRPWVEDVIGNNASGESWPIKVDRTAPSITLSGTLQANNGQTISDETYELNMDATDGSPASDGVRRSGVKTLELKVDGRRKLLVDQPAGSPSCPTDSCSLGRSWSFRTDDYSPGRHRITVIATDQLGQVKREFITVTVAKQDGAESIGPGTVTLSDGDFAVTRDDVAIDSFASDLTVSRTHRSREVPAPGTPDEREAGMFGREWVSSVPVDAAASDYVEVFDAASIYGDEAPVVELAFADDSAASFTANSDGTLTPPEEFSDLRLRKVGGDFELTDADGNVTVFRKLAGSAPDEPHKPVESRQVGAAKQTTYSYETVDGDARVIRALAPPPAGVTCGATETFVAGCRALTFHYAPANQAPPVPGQTGDYPKRLSRIDFHAADTANGAVTPTAVARYEYDERGRLRGSWDPRISPALKEAYSYDAEGHLTGLTPPGLEPWGFRYAPIAGDPDPGRLKSVSRSALAAGTATTTMAYRVPLTGTGAPHQMGEGDVARWSQGAGRPGNVPVEATAIFPADAVPADPPAGYGRASMFYLDGRERVVNRAAPGGHITTTEHNSRGNVIRELTAANRARALAAGASSAGRAEELDSERTFSADGLRLIDEVGPLHRVQLANGEGVDARRHVRTTYDEGAPAGGPYNLPTTTRVGAQIAGRAEDADVRVTTTGYGDGGWELRQPTSQTVDAVSGGLNLTTKTLYDPNTGLETERRMPAKPEGGDAHSTRTIYYSGAAQTAHPECGGKPAWANLVCKTLPAAQPGTPGLPDLSVTTYEDYSRLNQPRREVERVGATERVSTTEYDPAGRKTSEALTSQAGEPLPAVTSGYDSATGLPTTTQTIEALATIRTVSRTYDSLGRMTRYTDADGVTSTTSYDLLSRPTTTNDGLGQQTRSYDPDTGLPTSLQDSSVGTFGASYDADGKMTVKTLPNGMRAETTYDETGAPTRLRYEKTSNCSANCTWLDEQVTESIHGQWLKHTGTLSSQDYAYDPAARLTQVKDRPAGQGCTTRSYSYDADSNRTGMTTRAPATGGACDSSSAGTTTSHRYDAADRLTDNGYVYDAFGRTTTIPGPDAGGRELRSTYYVNDLVRSQTQGAHTVSYALDPLRRERSRTTATGSQTEVETSHYTDDGDSPAWTADDTAGTAWWRNVEGIDGDLAAYHTSGGTKRLKLANLHGDVVAEAEVDPAVTELASKYETDEFGVPRGGEDLGSRVRRHGFMGAKQRRTNLSTGVVQMGVRTYVPSIGRFTSVDPVLGGSANAYDYANADPVNSFDLDGREAQTSQAGLCEVYTPRIQKGPHSRFRGTYDYRIKWRARCRGDIGAWKLTGSIQKHRNNAFDPTVYQQSRSGYGNDCCGGGGWLIFVDYWNCEKDKLYNFNTTLNVRTRFRGDRYTLRAPKLRRRCRA